MHGHLNIKFHWDLLDHIFPKLSGAAGDPDYRRTAILSAVSRASPASINELMSVRDLGSWRHPGWRFKYAGMVPRVDWWTFVCRFKLFKTAFLRLLCYRCCMEAVVQDVKGSAVNHQVNGSVPLMCHGSASFALGQNLHRSVLPAHRDSLRTWCNCSWRLITACKLTRKLRYVLHPFPGQQDASYKKPSGTFPSFEQCSAFNSHMLQTFVRNFWHLFCCHTFSSKSGSSKRTFTYT